MFVRCLTLMNCLPPSVNHWGQWHHGNSLPRAGATPHRWVWWHCCSPNRYHKNTLNHLAIQILNLKVFFHYFHRWKNILRVMSPQEQKSENVCFKSCCSGWKLREQFTLELIYLQFKAGSSALSKCANNRNIYLTFNLKQNTLFSL